MKRPVIKQRRTHNHIHQIGQCRCGIEICLKCGPCPKCILKPKPEPRASLTVNDLIVLETAAKAVMSQLSVRQAFGPVQHQHQREIRSKVRTALSHVDKVLKQGGYRA